MTENKTKPTDGSIEDFLQTVSPQQRDDSYALIDIMCNISGHEPVLWGDSIIGFDSVHYKYNSGHGGDMAVIGFSPRKANMTIYIADGFGNYGDLLAKLGKHKTSVSCLYVKQLDDIDLDVLKQIIEASYKAVRAMYV